MLHRPDRDGLIVISQPAHAWVSGQLARNWGNKYFGDFAPAEEVCLAAEQHDIGFLDWEQSPALNSKTGLPQTFMEMPTQLHLDVWSKGIRQMLRFGRYPALLVSMHFTVLCQQNSRLKPPEEAQMVQNFLDDQAALQSTIRTSLLNDFYYAPCSTDEIIERNRQLVSLWDRLSLLLCMDFADTQVFDGVGSGEPGRQLTLSRVKGEPVHVRVEPWPFRHGSVRLICEGRRLLRTYGDKAELREALRAAAPVTVRMDLCPE